MRKQTEKTLHALLSGKHPQVKKFVGKQVFVIGDQILPLRGGEKALDDFKKLKEKYGEPPVVTFVPNPAVSYILISK